jgi:non-canonical poly(A) RNA polymerase PAPD5/7
LFPSPPLKPTSSLLHSLASLLLTSSLAEPSSLLVIAKARVPIVKFTTRYGGFAVDLSVNQGGGVDAAMKVRKLLEDHAHRDVGWVEPGRGEVDAGLVDHGVARSLVMLVKAFLNQRGMNEVFTGGLGSYSIICLVVSFLQVWLYLLERSNPADTSLQLHPKIQTGAIHPARNIGLLFAEFLEYYGKHFNFDEAGITLRGRGGYFNKHDKGWFRPNQPYLLSIEDPNDPRGSCLPVQSA